MQGLSHLADLAYGTAPKLPFKNAVFTANEIWNVNYHFAEFQKSGLESISVLIDKFVQGDAFPAPWHIFRMVGKMIVYRNRDILPYDRIAVLNHQMLIGSRNRSVQPELLRIAFSAATGQQNQQHPP